jgi:hypothetical protein
MGSKIRPIKGFGTEKRSANSSIEATTESKRHEIMALPKQKKRKQGRILAIISTE